MFWSQLKYLVTWIVAALCRKETVCRYTGLADVLICPLSSLVHVSSIFKSSYSSPSMFKIDVYFEGCCVPPQQWPCEIVRRSLASVRTISQVHCVGLFVVLKLAVDAGWSSWSRSPAFTISSAYRIQTEASETLVIVLCFVIKRFYRFVVLTSSCKAATTVGAFLVQWDRRCLQIRLCRGNCFVVLIDPQSGPCYSILCEVELSTSATSSR